MVNLESKNTENDSMELKIGHLQRLADAMAPDCKEWIFAGDVEEDDSRKSRCTCGHPIKWVFWLERQRDGARLPIGSTCITTSVPFLISHGANGLAKDLAVAQTAWRQMMADRMKLAREGKRTCELERVQEEAEQLLHWYSRLMLATEELTAAKQRRLPYRPPYFYEARYRDLRAQSKNSTTGRKALCIKRRIETFRYEAAQLRQCWHAAGCAEVWNDPPKS